MKGFFEAVTGLVALFTASFVLAGTHDNADLTAPGFSQLSVRERQALVPQLTSSVQEPRFRAALERAKFVDCEDKAKAEALRQEMERLTSDSLAKLPMPTPQREAELKQKLSLLLPRLGGEYPERDIAQKEIAALGEDVLLLSGNPLAKAAEENPSAEVRHRAESLVNMLSAKHRPLLIHPADAMSSLLHQDSELGEALSRYWTKLEPVAAVKAQMLRRREVSAKLNAIGWKKDHPDFPKLSEELKTLDEQLGKKGDGMFYDTDGLAEVERRSARLLAPGSWARTAPEGAIVFETRFVPFEALARAMSHTGYPVPKANQAVLICGKAGVAEEGVQLTTPIQMIVTPDTLTLNGLPVRRHEPAPKQPEASQPMRGGLEL